MMYALKRTMLATMASAAVLIAAHARCETPTQWVLESVTTPGKTITLSKNEAATLEDLFEQTKCLQIEKAYDVTQDNVICPLQGKSYETRFSFDEEHQNIADITHGSILYHNHPDYNTRNLEAAIEHDYVIRHGRDIMIAGLKEMIVALSTGKGITEKEKNLTADEKRERLRLMKQQLAQELAKEPGESIQPIYAPNRHELARIDAMTTMPSISDILTYANRAMLRGDNTHKGRILYSNQHKEQYITEISFPDIDPSTIVNAISNIDTMFNWENSLSEASYQAIQELNDIASPDEMRTKVATSYKELFGVDVQVYRVKQSFSTNNATK